MSSINQNPRAGAIGYATTVFGTRTARIGALLLGFVIIREASLRTSGFENGPIVCPVRLLTGLPCPGCGGTRAMGAICTGDFSTAWNLNPLAFVTCAALIIWAVRSNAINTVIQRVSKLFRSQANAIQITTVVILYVVAWIAAVARFDSGIL